MRSREQEVCAHITFEGGGGGVIKDFSCCLFGFRKEVHAQVYNYVGLLYFLLQLPQYLRVVQALNRGAGREGFAIAIPTSIQEFPGLFSPLKQ